MKHYNFHIASLTFSQAFCTRHVVASRGAFPPVVRVHLPRKADYNQKAPPDPLINLPLAKTEPTRKNKQTNKQVQNTIVIGFLKTVPNVLV